MRVPYRIGKRVITPFHARRCALALPQSTNPKDSHRQWRGRPPDPLAQLSSEPSRHHSITSGLKRDPILCREYAARGRLNSARRRCDARGRFGQTRRGAARTKDERQRRCIACRRRPQVPSTRSGRHSCDGEGRKPREISGFLGKNLVRMLAIPAPLCYNTIATGIYRKALISMVFQRDCNAKPISKR